MQNWSNVIIKKVIGSEEDPNGKVSILVPRFRKGILAKWLQPKLKKPFIRLKLDEHGSHAWKMMDGHTNFGDIAAAMKISFGDDFKQPEERLKTFCLMLHKGKFVEFFEEVCHPVKTMPSGAPANITQG